MHTTVTEVMWNLPKFIKKKNFLNHSLQTLVTHNSIKLLSVSPSPWHQGKGRNDHRERKDEEQGSGTGRRGGARVAQHHLSQNWTSAGREGPSEAPN